MKVNVPVGLHLVKVKATKLSIFFFNFGRKEVFYSGEYVPLVDHLQRKNHSIWVMNNVNTLNPGDTALSNI